MTDLKADPYDRPTRANVLTAIQEGVDEAKADDGLFLLYFSGHGIEQRHHSYLIPSDGTSQLLSRHAIDVDQDLRQVVEGANLKQAIVFVDACRTEPPGSKGIRVGAPSMTPGFKKHFQTRAFAVVFASSSGQASYEANGHGFFANALAAGLSGSVRADKDGNVTLGALYDYLRMEVHRQVWDLRFVDQDPDCIFEGPEARSLALGWSKPEVVIPVPSPAVPLLPPSLQQRDKENPEVVVGGPAKMKPPAWDSGRGRLVGWSTGFGFTLGLETYLALAGSSGNAVDALSIGNVTAAVAVGSTLLFTEFESVSAAQADTFNTGWQLGSVNGLLVAAALGNGSPKSDQFGRDILGIGPAVGNVAGAIAGALVAKVATPTEEQALAARSAGFWGLAAGTAALVMLAPVNCTQRCFGVLGTMDAALVGTSILTHYVRLKKGSIWGFDAGSVIGGSVALLVSSRYGANLSQRDEAASILTGLVAGGLGGYLVGSR
jgi:hypothetical protein